VAKITPTIRGVKKKPLFEKKIKKNRPGGGENAAPRQVKKKSIFRRIPRLRGEIWTPIDIPHD
jgi:hypothetical protein